MKAYGNFVVCGFYFGLRAIAIFEMIQDTKTSKLNRVSSGWLKPLKYRLGILSCSGYFYPQCGDNQSSKAVMDRFLIPCHTERYKPPVGCRWHPVRFTGKLRWLLQQMGISSANAVCWFMQRAYVIWNFQKDGYFFLLFFLFFSLASAACGFLASVASWLRWLLGFLASVAFGFLASVAFGFLASVAFGFLASEASWLLWLLASVVFACLRFVFFFVLDLLVLALFGP